MKPGVVRQLSYAEVAKLARTHRQLRKARHLAGFEYADYSAAERFKIANILRHGHTVIGPLYPEGGGIVNIVIMDAMAEAREREARING